MSVIQSCFDVKDVLDFFKPQGLYLKPISRLNVSVQLPQLKKSGAKISNWEVMEKVKEMAKPFVFTVFKVAKSSLEFIRFEAEIDNFGSIDQVLKNLDMKTIKLSGFQELLKVRAAEAKMPFPTRQDWDSFFRENKSMNEMKAGERPDTLHIENLPTKWFIDPHDRSGVSRDKPSEYVLKKVLSTFGEIRAIDIPLLDPYRNKMKTSISGIKTFSFGQDLVFDVFIQYKEYIGFVKAMNSLKGMKLLYKDGFEERSWVANIKVDFDKTKHLAESTIKKRSQEREKLIEKEREKEEAERKKKELEELKIANERRKLEEEKREQDKKNSLLKQVKLTRRMEREERRRRMKLLGKMPPKNDDQKIAEEERKLLIAQRKLESIRLLDELLDRVKTVKTRSDNVKNLENDLLRAARAAKDRPLGRKGTIAESLISYKDQDEKFLRDKLVSRLKKKEEDKMEEHRSKLKECMNLSDVSDTDREEKEEEEEDELRLTSSTEEEEQPRGEDTKRKKKEKKDKKKRKKEKKKKKKEEEDRKKRRELHTHISLAQRIAEREKRSRSKELYESQRCHDSARGSAGQPDSRAVDRMRERENRRLALKNQRREEEKAKEELYDKMVNPHLYGGSIPHTNSGTRKLRRGEHYEEIQKEHLENEIRIRERREKTKRIAEERRFKDEDRRKFKKRPPPFLKRYQPPGEARDECNRTFHSYRTRDKFSSRRNGGHFYRD